jgi:quercetin dioxygenase-like cupin family protein
MDREEFAAQLGSQGYKAVVEVEREPNSMMDKHSHPFDAKALILDGEIRIVVAGAERTYRCGEVFELSNGTEHIEHYGPKGVRYLVGRK